MRKVITLFQRNYETDRLVRNEIVPGAEWVIAGEGVATQKLDGTSCLVREGNLYKRYDAKAGKTPPSDFEPAQPEPDPITLHWPGWVPVRDNDPSSRWHREAWVTWRSIAGYPPPNGTYELLGPKIQGNPEKLTNHRLVPHNSVHLLDDVPRDYEGIRHYLASHDIEGIVWWRDIRDFDCDKVKIKAKDFGLKRSRNEEKKP